MRQPDARLAADPPRVVSAFASSRTSRLRGFSRRREARVSRETPLRNDPRPAATRDDDRDTKPGGIALIGDLLDKDKEQQIKSNSDLLTEAKLSLIKRYSEWRFIDLPRVLEYLETKAKKVEVLEQPKNFKCSYYRKDLRIWF